MRDSTAPAIDTAPPWRSTSALLVAACISAVALGGLFGAQRIVLRWARDLPLDIGLNLGIQVVPWLVWAMAVPAIAALCRRYAVDAAPALVSLARWSAIGVVAALLHTAATVVPVGLISNWEAVNLPLYVGFQQLLVNHGVGAFSEFALIVAVLQAVLMTGRAQSRAAQASALRAQLADAELRALRMQLEPHFLFNTINAIVAHVRDHPAVAEEMLRHLSDVLRSVLAGGEQPERPLREELDLVRAYLRIHQVRFGDRLAVRIDADDASASALAPALVLQPLVENAIAHGVSQRPGPASIAVTAARHADRLVVTVEDAGAPVSQSAESGHKIGLANTKQRLAHHYGSAGDVTMDRTPTKTVVTLSLPYVAVPA
ncbi:MAG: histidine kinase [Gemmatimonadaceae bacterium]|nr:histidine kinase [Gemmatimonadaceae bacterium]